MYRPFCFSSGQSQVIYIAYIYTQKMLDCPEVRLQTMKSAHFNSWHTGGFFIFIYLYLFYGSGKKGIPVQEKSKTLHGKWCRIARRGARTERIKCGYNVATQPQKNVAPWRNKVVLKNINFFLNSDYVV